VNGTESQQIRTAKAEHEAIAQRSRSLAFPVTRIVDFEVRQFQSLYLIEAFARRAVVSRDLIQGLDSI
jgi:hypothetical protein